MVDQPNGAPTVAPNVPVANGQPAAAPATNGDTLVPVVVDRQARQEPLSKLIASYQTQTAAENRLVEANRLLAEHKADLDLGRRIKAKVAVDPEGAVQEMIAFAEQQLGRRIKLPGAPAQTDDGDTGLPSGSLGPPSEQTRRMERQLAELQARVAGLTSTQQVESIDRQIETALDAYPIFREQSDAGKNARSLAKLTIAGLHSGQPDVAVADHASEIHSRMAAVLSSQVTQVRDQRQERVNTMPVAPTAGGTPELTTPAPDNWGKKSALRDGTFERRMKEFMSGITSPR